MDHPVQLALPSFNLKKEFLSGDSTVSLEVSSPGAPELLTALRTPGATIPAGDITLGNIKAHAEVGHKIAFGGDTKGTVTFSGKADGALGLGVYADAAAALKAAAPDPKVADGLVLDHTATSRFIVLSASYDISGSAKGSVALGAGASVTFGASGSTAGAFAVLHRFEDATAAVQVFEDLFESWALPRQIDTTARARALKPGTWLVAEVDGSIALQLGVQAGYDFSWMRQLPDGALEGNIGLQVKLGATAALGFEAGGKYAFVLGRENDDQKLRLRLYKMARKGWSFAFDARAGIQGTLPPWFDQDRKAEDLVAAIFGLNHNQVIDVLRETRSFVNSKVSLQDKLAGVLMDLGGKSIEAATGLSEEEIRKAYEAGRQKVVDLLAKLDQLEKSGGHELTSLLLSVVGAKDTGNDLVGKLTAALKDITQKGTAEQVQALVRELSSKAGFERTPAGVFIDTAAGAVTDVLADSELAKKLQSVAGDALAVLDGSTLQKLLDYLRQKINLDQIEKVVTQTDFDKLDNLLQSRIAAFLGKQTVAIAELNKVQAAIKTIFANVDKFFDIAIKAAKQKQEFAFVAKYDRATTSTALLDLEFDFSAGDAESIKLFQQAVDGNFDSLLVTENAAVKINTAELTHGIQRNVSSELTLPFGAVSESSTLLSDAKLTLHEDGGRVLVYSLDTSDKKKERTGIFRAHHGRDSTLTIAATLPVGVSKGLKIWKPDTFNYSFRMQRATLRMRASQMLAETQPVIDQYLPNLFGNPATPAFPEWVADLDKALDEKDPHSGTHDIGDTLTTLSLTSPPSYLRAWTNAPKDGKDPLYMNLSRAMQAKLKEMVMFYYFSDPSHFNEVDSAAPALVYCCIPPSTQIRLDGDDLQDLNTDKDIYWDEADSRKVRAMVNAPQTLTALSAKLADVSRMLRGIPEMASTASFYTPDELGNILSASLKKRSATSPVPELLGSLLFLEATLVRRAIDSGKEMARFRAAAAQKPAEALKHLAKFGEDLANTFNETVGSNPFLSSASRPLATLLFLTASKVFDKDVKGDLSSMLNIKVISSGKLSVDDMLAGKIDDDSKLILFEQPFVA